MILRKPSGLPELKHCIDMYADIFDKDFLPVCTNASTVSAMKMLSDKSSMFLVIEVDGKIRGFVAGSIINIAFMKEPVVRQMFYMSDLKGMQSVKALLKAHQALIDFAEENGIQFVYSESSFLDSKNKVVGILSKRGWQSRGFAAVYKTSHCYNR